MDNKPLLKKGDKLLIRTVSYFQAGEFVEMRDGFIHLKDASWIADTGRFTESVVTASFAEVEIFAKPVLVNVSAIVDITFLPSLPISQK
jgi:hypothetical protein